ncbi:MAG: lipid A biosynthesis lauroyl acyltransferase [Alphaproteobacteria bacterium]|nr:lipid A biosynthesis lauroyl acyltransferase [Alphaproteobacteria bacterium]
MSAAGTRLALRLRRLSAAVRGAIGVGIIKAIRAFDPDTMARIAAVVMRRIGPWLPEHRIGRENLKAAFPEKSPAEIEAILRGVWDNLGRVAAEFAHIDRLWDYDPVARKPGRILDSDDAERIAVRLRDDGKPALVFSAHLANWELGAAGAHSYGVDTTIVYRRPNLRAVSDLIVKLRASCMGTLVHTGMDTPAKLAEALERGSHVAMLVDQYTVQGVPVRFFGRVTKANPMIARLARHFDCPIHGIRMVRYPNNHFQLRLTEAIEPARDAEGRIDVERTMQVITNVVEGWIRERPEQWLWVHRRWK